MNQVQLALVSPPFYRGKAHTIGEIPPVNLGIGYLASYIESKGFHVDLYDFSSSKSEQIEKTIISYDLPSYDLVGITVYSQTYVDAVKIAAAIKKKNQNSMVVLGGPHATAASLEILRSNTCVDFVVRGEGEVPLEQLVNCIGSRVEPHGVRSLTFRTKNGEIIANPPLREYPLLDSLPYPRRSSKNSGSPFLTYYNAKEKKRKKALTVSVGRGCPYGCAFCVVSSTHRAHRTRSPGSVLEEIKSVYNEHQFDHIWFVDADFLIDPKSALGIGRGLKTIKESFTWNCTGRADQIVKARHILPQLAACGLVCVEVGVESGSNMALRRWNKGTNVETNRKAIQIMQELDIEVALDFIMFDPSAKLIELKENILFLKEAGFYGYFPHDILMSQIRLYPSTPLRDFYEERWREDWNANIIPNYEFEDANVRSVYASLSFIDKKLFRLFNSFVPIIGNILYAMINHEKYKKKEFPLRIQRRLQRLQLSQHVISLIPYVIFEEIVHNVRIKKNEVFSLVNDLLGTDILAYLDCLARECGFFQNYFHIDS